MHDVRVIARYLYKLNKLILSSQISNTRAEDFREKRSSVTIRDFPLQFSYLRRDSYLEREFKGLIFVIWRRGDVSQTINTFSYASFVCKCTMTQYPRPPRTIIRNKLSIAQHTACGKQFGTRICTLGVWGKTHCTPETLPPSLLILTETFTKSMQLVHNYISFSIIDELDEPDFTQDR